MASAEHQLAQLARHVGRSATPKASTRRVGAVPGAGLIPHVVISLEALAASRSSTRVRRGRALFGAAAALRSSVGMVRRPIDRGVRRRSRSAQEVLGLDAFGRHGTKARRSASTMPSPMRRGARERSVRQRVGSLTPTEEARSRSQPKDSRARRSPNDCSLPPARSRSISGTSSPSSVATPNSPEWPPSFGRALRALNQLLSRPATMLIVTATITVPNMYDNRAWAMTDRRITLVVMSVSDTW